MTRAEADASQARPTGTSASPNDPSPAGCPALRRSCPSGTHPRRVLFPSQAVLADRVGGRVMAQAARLAANIPGSVGSSSARTTRTTRRLLRHRELPHGRRTPAFPTSSGTDAFLHLPVRDHRRRGRSDGAGRSPTQFQLSSRADFFEVEVGLETTLKRPIINTRDGPHRPGTLSTPARDRRRRDAMSEVATYLGLGMTSLVLAMLEASWLTGSMPLKPVTGFIK